MRITDPLGTHMALYTALSTGPVLVTIPRRGSRELCAIGPGPIAYDITFLLRAGRAWLISTWRPGGERRAVGGTGCDHYGLPLPALTLRVLTELAERASRLRGDVRVVRGEHADFFLFHQPTRPDARTTGPAGGSAHVRPVIPVTWQWYQDDRDITTDVHAGLRTERDANRIRVLREDFSLVVLHRERLADSTSAGPTSWRIGHGDARCLDALTRVRFRSPAAALRQLSAAHGLTYTARDGGIPTGAR